MNLYLYIPSCSAHPPTMITSLIFGRLRAYYRHNTDNVDYYRMVCLLVQRLVDRGWSFKKIKPIFKEAHERITGKKKRQNKPKSKIIPILIHTKFHPRAIQRNRFRQIDDDTLRIFISIPLIVAVSRPKNLRERLRSSKLKLLDGLNPFDFL